MYCLRFLSTFALQTTNHLLSLPKTRRCNPKYLTVFIMVRFIVEFSVASTSVCCTADKWRWSVTVSSFVFSVSNTLFTSDYTSRIVSIWYVYDWWFKPSKLRLLVEFSPVWYHKTGSDIVSLHIPEHRIKVLKICFFDVVREFLCARIKK